MKYQLRIIIGLAIVFLNLATFAQPVTSWRSRIVIPGRTVYKLDTVSIAPGTFVLKRLNGDTIPEEAYILNPWQATLQFTADFNTSRDSVLIAFYRVMPLMLMTEYKDDRLKPEQELKKGGDLSYLYSYSDQRQQEGDGFFSFGNLEKSGSISRSISIGNNQDAVLNSTMNLQLSGELAPGIGIVAAITDNTIPIQPEGSSQQLREFDKVFIKARSQNWEITAGDFDVKNGQSTFLRFNKRGQGALFSGSWKTGKSDEWRLSARISGAIARGKYTQNAFNGIEGNQGPYKLLGAANESFIVVLAGSERIFMDGKLLTRGANNDYIIDYNAAQITFTPKVPVTKDKRFIVDFEYAERNYNRSMIYFHQVAETDKVSLQLQYFNEQDLKSQPIGQEQMVKDNMELLKTIGDNFPAAVVPNVKEVPWSNSEVLYKRTDSLVGTILYDPVYVYSTHPDSARYRLGFSFVGQGNGHYRQTTNAANGKVFQWIAPVNGIPQGDHEPLILLITPKRQQMVTFSGNYKASPRLQIFFETALSATDLNTFSHTGDHDNTGMAFTAGITRKTRPGKQDESPWVLETGLMYRLITKRFSAVEQFRDIEFNRDWNITGTTASDEHLGKLQFRLSNKKAFITSYTFEPLVKDKDDYSLRHSGTLRSETGKWRMNGWGSLLTSDNPYLSNRFLRHTVTLDRRIGSMVFGILEEGENNRFQLPGQDTLHKSSFAFQRWQASLERADTLKIKTSLRIGQRYDYLPVQDRFTEGSHADEIWGGIGSDHNANHRFDLNVGYRNLHVQEASTGKGPEESLLGRGEYNHRFFNGLLKGTLFYEFGSGLEYKKEFTYLEVAPGQGIYTWKDYNGDSIKQLDEFEVAVFQDEASYIRIFTPTNEFERVYMMQYSQSLQIEPASVANREKTAGRLLARFSDQGYYRIEQKRGGNDVLKALDPWFANRNDPEMISLNYSLRNTLFFNRSSSTFSLDYTTTRNESKVLLVNGFERRGQIQHTLRARWNLTREFILRTEGNTGIRERSSEFFSGNDYRIAIMAGNAELQYQPGTKYRVGIRYSYTDKKNNLGAKGEHAGLHRGGMEFRYSIPMKGSLQALAEYIGIQYNSLQQNSVAFEMLEGLRTGNNFTWTLGYQRILVNNLQVNLQYNGRKSPETPTVHVGTVQVRAFF